MIKKRIIAAVLVCATILSTGSMMKISSQAAEKRLVRYGSVTVHVTEKSTQEQMEGVEYECYKIMDFATNDDGILKASPTEEFEEVMSGIERDEIDNYSAKEIEGLLQQLKEVAENVDEKLVLTTDESGSVCFADLTMGYYLFVETKVPEGYAAGESFIVSVPTADVSGNEISYDTWDYDVDVYVKHEKISVEKELSEVSTSNGLKETIQDGSVSEGDYVQYTVKTAIPDFSEDYFYKNESGEYKNDVVFDITDVMSDGLTVQNTETHPVLVSVGGKTAVAGTDYQVIAEEVKDASAADLKIEFSNEFLENNIGKEVVVTYFAYVNSDAVMGTTGNNNTIALEYSNSPTEGTTIKTSDEESEVDVYTFGINLLKFTKEDETKPLEGAEFVVYANGNMYDPYCENLVSDAEGNIEIPLLDEGTYYIGETKAPEGYTPLIDLIKVEIIADKDAEGHATGTFTLKVNDKEITAESGEYVTIQNQETGISTIAVENHKGFTLPETGGNGVTAFVLAGAAGMLILIMRISKKSRQM